MAKNNPNKFNPNHSRIGPWDYQEKQFIKDMASVMTPSEIATRLKRNVKTVISYIDRHGLIPADKIAPHALEVAYDIRKSPHWEQIQQQFNMEELTLFLYHWNNMIKQFKDDVLHTEELQIIDTIKVTILMERILKQERETHVSIARVMQLLEEEMQVEEKKRDKPSILQLEKQLSFSRAALDSINKQFRDLLDKKNNLLKEMKATREARIKYLESSKETLTGWMRQLISNRELRLQLGRDMEKMRLAMDQEVIRLSEWHQYEDGVIDQPLLNCDTVKEE